MALDATEAKKNIEREVTIKSGVKGFPDRTFLYKLTTSGTIEVREKSKPRKKRVVRVEDFVKWVILFATEKE